MVPWTTAEIESARGVPFYVLLRFLGAYCKVDRGSRSANSAESIRFM